MSQLATTHRKQSRARGARQKARVSGTQKALFQRVAELQRHTLTDFDIAGAHDAPVMTIREMKAIRLDAADSRAFAEALLEPRPPTRALRAAARRYRALIGQ